jgi:hypothetical protein
MILAANPAQKAAPPAPYRCEVALTQLFTPARPVMGRYEVCTTDDPIERLVADGPALPARYGEVEALEALDAFGASGTYHRSALARLYGGNRVRIVRGWTVIGDEFQSITLLSPYPDESLSRLLPGTMAIRWTTRR